MIKCPSKLRLLSGALAGLVLAACDMPSTDSGSETAKTARETIALFDDLAHEELTRSPETASRLGISTDTAGYDYRGRLDDRSQAAFERTRLQRIEALERLERLPDASLNLQLTATKAVTIDAYRRATQMAGFGHGHVSLGYARPYVADQITGTYSDIPDLLINRQQVRSKQDASAYLERLSALGPAIDDEGRRLQADAAAGIVPPDFILDRMLNLSEAFRQTQPDTPHALVQTYERLLGGASDLSEEEREAFIARAADIVEAKVEPAYRRLETRLRDLAQDAPSEPGIWQIPDGEAYYDAALEFYTGSTQPADALHRDGQRLVTSLTQILDEKLTAIELAEGTIGERLAALSSLEGQIYANDEVGQAALLARLQDLYDRIDSRLDEVVPKDPHVGVTIAPVPVMLQNTAPGGYYLAPPADGSAPALFYINLRDTAEWPDFTLPSLLFHETIPGHHLESIYFAQSGRPPLIRQMIWTPVYGEGWALYSEDIANELGLYADDPLGEIGYLQSLLFRAARLVADTGIHKMRWGREETIDYLVETTGQSRSAMETEVDRYTVWPGQAAAYMIGRLEILRLRNRAEEVLSSKFRAQDFHTVILANGPRPMSQVERDVDAWIASVL